MGYLPGLAMRRSADLHRGQAKTDARDAAIIAEAARPMPHTPRSVELDDETLAELEVLCGFDDDLAGQITATSNRSAEDCRSRTRQSTAKEACAKGRRTPDRSRVRGPGPADGRGRGNRCGRDRAAETGRAAPDPAGSATRSRVRTCARILTEVTGKHFASAAHLASYAGIAPVTRRCGTSIRGEHPSRRGNRKLKRALFLSAFAALHHPPSRAYYDRKRVEGKRHNQAIIALARRRSDVLFATLRDGTLYEDPAPKNLPSAA